MMRRASPFPFVPLGLVVALAALGPSRAAAQPAEELPADGHNALMDENDKWKDVWRNLVAGQEVADPANTQHQQAIDAAARYATYRLTWGPLEKEAGKLNQVHQDLNENLTRIRLGGDKTQKLGELYTKQVIAHSLEVLQTHKPIARINAAMVLARLPARQLDEKPDDALHRLAGTNQADLADALASIIKDPKQIDAARLWAFKGLQDLLSLPQAMPPALPREKEDAALGEVLNFLKARNAPLPPGTSDEESDGFRYLRREAIKALAQSSFPTLSTLPDKPRVALALLKIAARDGVEPEPRIDERVEAAIGVARSQPTLDKDYQPEYAAHQLGLFVVDFVTLYDAEKQAQANAEAAKQTLPSTQPWKIEASRLIEALEDIEAQANKPHVALVVDESLKVLAPIEKASAAPNVADLDSKLKAEASPAKELYQGVPESTVTFGGKGAPPAPPKPDDKKDK